jgi:hypothetical protein
MSDKLSPLFDDLIRVIGAAEAAYRAAADEAGIPVEESTRKLSALYQVRAAVAAAGSGCPSAAKFAETSAFVYEQVAQAAAWVPMPMDGGTT